MSTLITESGGLLPGLLLGSATFTASRCVHCGLADRVSVVLAAALGRGRCSTWCFSSARAGAARGRREARELAERARDTASTHDEGVSMARDTGCRTRQETAVAWAARTRPSWPAWACR